MPRLIIAILATVILVVFSMANTHHIELSLIFGSPAEVRLIFLLASTYFGGLMTGVIWGMIRRLKERNARPPPPHFEETFDLVKD